MTRWPSLVSQSLLFATLGLLATANTSAGSLQPPNKDEEIERAAAFFGTATQTADSKPPKAKPKEEKVTKVAEDENAGQKKDDGAESKNRTANADNHDHPIVVGEEPDEEAPLKTVSAAVRALHVELAFVRRVCQLTADQEIELDRTFDAAWIKKNVQQSGLPIVNGRPIGAGGPNEFPNAARSGAIRALSNHLKELLTEEQWTKYQREVDERKKFESATRIELLLVLLKKSLLLSESQMEQLREPLSKASVNEEEYFEYYDMYDYYLPQLPDAIILKVLSPNQRKVYEGIQKVQFGMQEDALPIIKK